MSNTNKPAAHVEAKHGNASVQVEAQPGTVKATVKDHKPFLEKPFLGSRNMTNGDALADGAFFVGVAVVGTVATFGAVVLAQKLFGGMDDTAFGSAAFEL